MTVLFLALLALVLAVGWALDSHCQRIETRKDYERLAARVKELGGQVQAVRKRHLHPIDRPVVRWHDDVEVVGR